MSKGLVEQAAGGSHRLGEILRADGAVTADEVERALVLQESAVGLPLPPSTTERVARLPKRYSLAQHEDRVNEYATRPSVDVLLPISGEDLAVIDNTWRHVMALRWAGPLTVHVLDPGRRPEVRRLAAHYGFAYTDKVAVDAAGEFVLVLEAGLAVHEDTLLDLMPATADPMVGVVSSYGVKPVTVHRRSALEVLGADPRDPAVSDALTAAGMTSVTVPLVLAKGLELVGMRSIFDEQYRTPSARVPGLVTLLAPVLGLLLLWALPAAAPVAALLTLGVVLPRLATSRVRTVAGVAHLIRLHDRLTGISRGPARRYVAFRTVHAGWATLLVTGQAGGLAYGVVSARPLPLLAPLAVTALLTAYQGIVVQVLGRDRPRHRTVVPAGAVPRQRRPLELPALRF